MSTSTHPATSGGLVQISPTEQPVNRALDTANLEELIRQRVAEERVRLEQQAGLIQKEVHHYHKPIERPFTAEQRSKTTLLFGGLTWKHEK
jgi:hypothetical protein